MKQEEKKELVKRQAVTALVSASQTLFFDIEKFEHAQRVAKMLSQSTLIPDHFRNNVGNCVIALNYAERIKADPFMVMQALYVVHGRPGIEGKLVIALVNQCGRFEPLDFEFSEDRKSCTAIAKDIKSGKILRGTTITWEMVQAEGWASKNGSKWQTMPEQMYRYRAAAFFARVYCPEVLLGMQTIEEIEDFVDLKKRPNGSYVAPEKPPVDGAALKTEINGKLEAMKKQGVHQEGFEDPIPPSPATSESKPWNPLAEPLQERYGEEKRNALSDAAKHMGVSANTMKLTARKAHEYLLGLARDEELKEDSGMTDEDIKDAALKTLEHALEQEFQRDPSSYRAAQNKTGINHPSNYEEGRRLLDEIIEIKGDN